MQKRATVASQKANTARLQLSETNDETGKVSRKMSLKVCLPKSKVSLGAAGYS